MFKAEISSAHVTMRLPRIFHGEQGAALIEEIITLLRAGHRNFVFDMREVSSLDSMGVGVMAQAAKTVGDWGGSVALSHLTSEVSSVMSLTGVGEIFSVVKG